jgi:hypothetical protein
MSALLSLDGQLRRQYILFHVALVSVPIRLLAVKPKSVMRNFVHFAIKRLLLHSVFGVIVSVQFIVSFLHSHRAYLQFGVAGLPPARMAAVVIVLVIGRWRDIVFLTKNPN